MWGPFSLLCRFGVGAFRDVEWTATARRWRKVEAEKRISPLPGPR